MKTYETFLLGVYAALSRDIVARYPKDATEWKWAQARLRLLVKTRGIRFLTVDLVKVGKHFDQCLSTGLYAPSHVAGFASWKGQAVPRLFRGLLSRVFIKSSGKLRPDLDIQAISLLRQLFYTAKKIRMACDDKATYETVAEFFEIEKGVRSPTLDWEGDDISAAYRPDRVHILDGLVGGTTGDNSQLFLQLDTVEVGASTVPTSGGRHVLHPDLLATIQRVADVVVSDFGLFDTTKVMPRHGPGAVADKQGSSKYDFPYWPQKLTNLFPPEDFAFYNSSAVWVDQEDGGPLLSKGEPPSVLYAVPKTQKGPRLIAAEPTAHQWIQQGILALLLTRMADSCLGNCIDIFDQSPSRELAVSASIHGHLSTVDLSSASDHVSCWLVERLFRSNLSFLQAFHASRTRWLVNSVDKKFPKFTKLRKFSTMGSALTFPVQSIAYALICMGVDIWFQGSSVKDGQRSPIRDTSRVNRKDFADSIALASRRIRVFGDDLIVPVESTSLLVEVLTYLGLKVNLDKTFAAGFFRESCGVDAYAGVDVTPTYVNEIPNDTEPETLISAVESSNNLFRRGLWYTSDYLVSELPTWFRNKLGIKSLSSGAFGLVSFVGADTSHLKSRWNPELHHEEVLAFTAFPKGRKKRGIRGGAALLQYFTEKPPPTVKWMNGVGLRTPLTLKRMGIPSYFFT